MKEVIHNYHVVLNRNYLIKCIPSLVLLTLALIVNYYAGLYAAASESNPVTDIILSNIRVFDVDGIFVYGSVAFWVFVVGLIVFDPKKIPFTLKSVSLFIVIRSCFISLTHIGQFPTHLIPEPLSLMNFFTFGGDLFFSGHTGLPFLMALIFWQNRMLRYTFIALSVFFGIVVLMGHLHYTIDVVAAFFITHTIYTLSVKAFPIDRRLFYEGLEVFNKK